MSPIERRFLLGASACLAIGAILHLWAVGVGAEGYRRLGAPAGLIALIDTGSLRPALSGAVIAAALLVAAAYGASAAGLGPRLPLRRPILSLIAAGLIARGLLLPVVAGWRPGLLRGLCGQCQSVNGFVLVTSALCLAVGCAYAIGAWRSSGPG